jgi:uncharacterized protein
MSAVLDEPPQIATAGAARARLSGVDWTELTAALDARGVGVLAGVLGPEECTALADLYAQDGLFRSRVLMSRHGFGQGEYRYFDYPLPSTVASLRAALYLHLASVANRWNERLRLRQRYPAAHASFIERCHAAGQRRPTPLLLKYGEGDYNCLHQDLYGEHVFPLQVTVLLSRPEADFTGGELVLVEQRPRRQSRAEVVPLRQGDAAVFAVSQRPVSGTRGDYRVNMRHGVSRLQRGRRYTLGIIFHDAR